MTIDNADLQFLSSNGRLNQPSSNDNSSMVDDKTGKKQCKLWRRAICITIIFGVYLIQN